MHSGKSKKEKKAVNKRVEMRENLRNLTIEEIESAYEYQCKHTDWTFYTERAFIENLFTNRFNFLIVIYSLFVTAFATIQGRDNKLIILILALIITTMMSITLIRVYEKLMINLKILHKLNEKHVFPMISKEIINTKKLGNVNPILAVYIPLTFIISLILGIVFISLNLWEVK